MKVHNVWFKPTADLLAKDYRALGFTVRVLGSLRDGYQVRVWK